MVYLPKPDYSYRYRHTQCAIIIAKIPRYSLWKELILSAGGNLSHSDFDLSSLTKISDGWVPYCSLIPFTNISDGWAHSLSIVITGITHQNLWLVSMFLIDSTHWYYSPIVVLTELLIYIWFRTPRPPVSLNYHFRVSPSPPKVVTLYHSRCVVFQHILCILLHF